MSMRLTDIKLKTEEGKLLFAAMVIISTEYKVDKTPDEILNDIVTLKNKMFQELTDCDYCSDINGFYLGTTCPKCFQPFRAVRQNKE
jgi:uncharacterized paraquat-inducible protein A